MAFKLPRLPVNWREQPQLFERYWDETMLQIEKTLNAILEIPIIKQQVTDAQQAAEAAQAAAENAQNTADNAQSNTGAVALENNLVNSYVGGFTGPLITANGLGVVTIQAHQRIYPDTTLNPTVSVSGGTINTGELEGAVIRIYYDDPSRSGGTVTYQYTVDPGNPPVQANGRHSVGVVAIPAAGGSSDGKNIRPAGYVEL